MSAVEDWFSTMREAEGRSQLKKVMGDKIDQFLFDVARLRIAVHPFLYLSSTHSAVNVKLGSLPPTARWLVAWRRARARQTTRELRSLLKVNREKEEEDKTKVLKGLRALYRVKLSFFVWYHLCRKRDNIEKEAAAAIQKLWRSHTMYAEGKKERGEWRKRREVEALERVKGRVRSYMQRRKMQRTVGIAELAALRDVAAGAALIVQRVYRSYAVRLRLRRSRAITKIQAVYRGYAVRKVYRKEKFADIEMERKEKDWNFKLKEVGQVLSFMLKERWVKNDAARVLQRSLRHFVTWRAFNDKLRLRRRLEAARLVEEWARDKAGKKIGQWAMHAVKEKRRREEEKRRENAAILVQRRFRRYRSAMSTSVMPAFTLVDVVEESKAAWWKGIQQRAYERMQGLM